MLMPDLKEITDEMKPQTIISKYIRKLHNLTNRNVIVYYSGWLTFRSTEKDLGINDLDKNAFMNLIKGLDKDKGLDLILHTPGGEIGATESIIDYLYETFKGDFRVIIPQIAMSGGTMIACSSKEIIMGKQSSLGPIDSQFGGISVEAILKECQMAKEEIASKPETIPYWNILLSKYPPAFIIRCENSRKWSEEILDKSLRYAMFDESDEKIINKIKSELGSHENTKSHGRHLSAKDCKNLGLKISYMEDDDEFQDIVLSIHHACMNFFSFNCDCIKFFANSDSKLYYM